MSTIRSIPGLVLLCTLAVSSPVSALQVLDGAEGQTLIGKASLRELTRIRVDGERIKRVTGNAGEFLLEKDEDRGQIYIRPAAEGATKPINLFIATEQSTYTLLLQPVDLPADTIVVRSPRRLAPTGRMARSASHVRLIKNLLLAMADDSLPLDLDVQEVGRELALWKEVRFSLTRRYIGPTLVGEKFLLTNVSTAPLTLLEQMLYKDGVLAVGVEKNSLSPAESTNVFVVRERTEP